MACADNYNFSCFEHFVPLFEINYSICCFLHNTINFLNVNKIYFFKRRIKIKTLLCNYFNKISGWISIKIYKTFLLYNFKIKD
ncbi:MAG: hypothetical protein DBY32_05855 [Phascolarctobacterium sp.]|nr:MAG: hypothetical protein DBY32_05855 [Phascolarctobacterium sp.]